MTVAFPDYIPNWIGGQEKQSLSGKTLNKFDPHTGKKQSEIAASTTQDVESAIEAAQTAKNGWAEHASSAAGEYSS